MNTETSQLLIRLRIEEHLRQAEAERLARSAKASAPRRRRGLPHLGPILVRLPWRTDHA
jgi:hypothetical protein